MTNNELATRHEQIQVDLEELIAKSEKLSAELDYITSDEWEAEIAEQCRQAERRAKGIIKECCMPFLPTIIASGGMAIVCLFRLLFQP